MSKKTVVVGVTGGIACYKACDVVSRLVKKGYSVKVIMTKNATEFVAPLTFQSLTSHPVAVDTFEKITDWDIEHISLAKAADVFLVVPATANIVGKVASGIADDLLSTTIMATKATVFFALAMNTNMYENPIFQRNVASLSALGYRFIQPEEGRLACGDVGRGKLADPADIVSTVEAYLEKDASPVPLPMKGRKVLVTAGPTRERIDPVRYLTNFSSGKQGYAIAREAQLLGASVTLISGPVCREVLEASGFEEGLEVVRVDSAEQMYNEVMKRRDYDIFIMSAAPSDYRVKEASAQKIKKDGAPLTLELVENVDILAAIGERKGSRQYLVGFAAETEHLIANAESKRKKKNADMIVANDVSEEGAGFDSDTNIVSILTASGRTEYHKMSKREVARVLLDAICRERAGGEAEDVL